MGPPDSRFGAPRAKSPSEGRSAFRTVLLAALLICACRSTVAGPPDELRCVFSGEFPPTDCTFVRGVALRENGEPWAGLVVHVDSAVPMVGYAYASNAASTDDRGRFSMQVVRVNRLVPRTDPDTVVIEFKGLHISSTRPVGRALLRLRFVPQDSLVIPTDTVLRFIAPTIP